MPTSTCIEAYEVVSDIQCCVRHFLKVSRYSYRYYLAKCVSRYRYRYSYINVARSKIQIQMHVSRYYTTLSTSMPLTSLLAPSTLFMLREGVRVGWGVEIIPAFA
jgi:hypothetical protein